MMLEIVDGYSRDFKVKFGGDKSKVMVINGDETDRDREWNIGEVKIDALRGDLGWSLFSERMVNAVLNYKVRIERMENKRWVKQIFEWNLSESLWEKICWGHARKLESE
ncbi:hypothetical protein FHG87_025936 [Trinorchestia longiramus]|nr:hypothetical protein FHG87_025936 [Trinorchestia longiramus]